MKLLIVNGPNLNLLGKREPETYGETSFDEYFNQLKEKFPSIELTQFQSNIEGELINCIQKADENYHGIILNAGGYTHTSVAIRDSIGAVITPVLEVHISNISKRESFRHESMLSPVACGVIMGMGLLCYDMGILYFSENNHLSK